MMLKTTNGQIILVKLSISICGGSLLAHQAAESLVSWFESVNSHNDPWALKGEGPLCNIGKSVGSTGQTHTYP